MQDIISNFESLSEEMISKFAGQWIAVINSQVVAHSRSFAEVHKIAKEKYPTERPLISKLPEAIPLVLSIA